MLHNKLTSDDLIGLSVDDMAKLLQMERKALLRSSIPKVKVGGRWRYMPERVKEWMRQNEVTTNEQG